MNKQEKSDEISVLKGDFEKANAAFFADYKGLTVEQVNSFRSRLRKENVKVRVIKNNLARLAVREAKLGSKSEEAIDRVAGPTMVAFAFGDPAAAAKSIKKFADENEVFNLKEGLLQNQVLQVKDIEELATLPSREVLLAKLLGTLNAPITNFAGVLAAVPRSLVQVLSAITEEKKKKG